MTFRISILLIIYLISVKNIFCEDDINSGDTTIIFQTPSITVTSTRAISGESPIPFIELSRQEIDKTYIAQDIPNILNGMPSIIFYSENGNSVGYSYLTMRGFTQRQISIMVNGIPQNDPEDHNVYWHDMPDLMSSVDNIQVQRGAGLINYGSAAIGGSISLSTTNYLNKKGVFITNVVGYQTFNDKISLNVNRQSIEFSSGLTENMAYYGRLSRIYSNGYRKNAWAELNSFFMSASRFDKNVTTQINVFGGPVSDGLAYTGLPKSYINDSYLRRENPCWGCWGYDTTGKNVSWFMERNKLETEWFSQPHFEILNDWKADENIRFLSSLFYYQGKGYFDGFNPDFWGLDTIRLRITNEYGWQPTANPGNSLIRSWVFNRQGGWIPRMIINHGNGEFTAGVEMRFHRSGHWGNIEFAENLPTGFDPEFRVYDYNGVRNILSGFLKESFDLTENLRINAEAQVVSQFYAIENEKWGGKPKIYQKVDGGKTDMEGEIFSIKYLFINPRIGMNYKINGEQNLYFFTAYTSREPRMSNLYDASSSYWDSKPNFPVKYMPDSTLAYDFTKPLTKPEHLLDIEMGYQFNTESFSANINLYWMEYYNELVKSGKVNIFGESIEANIPRARHLGAEIQIGWNAFKSKYGNFDVKLNTTISSNKISDFQYQTIGDTISLNGNSIAGFPNFLGNLILDYSLEDFYLRFHIQSVGGYKSDNYGDFAQTKPEIMKRILSKYSYADDFYEDNNVEPYTVINVNLGYTLKNFLSMNTMRFFLNINNLLNKFYAAGADGKEFFPGAERNFYLGIELGW